MLSAQSVLPGGSMRHVTPWRVSRTVRCTCCDITLNSHQQARQHYNGKAHQRRLQKLYQPRQPDTETPTTESRDREPKRDADAEHQSSGADDVISQQPDAEAVSMTTMMHDSEGK